MVSQTAEKGAGTSLYLATCPDVAGVTGKYFKGTRQIRTNPIAQNAAAARRLWQISEQLTAASATAP